MSDMKSIDHTCTSMQAHTCKQAHRGFTYEVELLVYNSTFKQVCTFTFQCLSSPCTRRTTLSSPCTPRFYPVSLLANIHHGVFKFVLSCTHIHEAVDANWRWRTFYTCNRKDIQNLGIATEKQERLWTRSNTDNSYAALLAGIRECDTVPVSSSMCAVCLLNTMAYVNVPDMWSKNHQTYDDKRFPWNSLY